MEIYLEDVKWLCLACSSICGSVILSKYLKQLQSYFVIKSDTFCYFLTDDKIRGRNYSADFWNMLSPIVEFINETQHTLDICFYLITDFSIVTAMLEAKKRNVTIRLITDHSSGILNNKFARNFYKEGIKIYSKVCNPGQTIMHSKFLIRDKEIMLHASMNLTKNTSKGSFDNFIITKDSNKVQTYQKHFDYLVTELKKECYI